MKIKTKLDYKSSLAFNYPKHAKEWHPTKNGDLTASDVLPNSTFRAWWIDEHGHEWDTKVSNKIHTKKCPYCMNYKVGYGNSFGDTHPEHMKFWHPAKNGELTPYMVTAGMNRKIWLIDEHGHEWQTSIISFSKKNADKLDEACPYCTSRKLGYGNSLGDKYPELIKEWHPTKNGNLTPFVVLPNSVKKVWWIDEEKHEWNCQINSRAISKTNCPFCSRVNRRAGYGYSFGDKYPELAKSWHPTKNGELTPFDVTPGSEKSIWWICEHGHSLNKTPLSMIVSKNKSCPVCSSLGFKYPEIAKEWHPTKNEGMTPMKTSSGSTKKVWWIDDSGYEWKANISLRCAGMGLSPRKTSFKFKYPELAKCWNVIRNKEEMSFAIKPSNSKRVWWIMKDGTEVSMTPLRFIDYYKRFIESNLIKTESKFINELHPLMNKDINELSSLSTVNVWWLDKEGHKWQATPKDRVKGKSNCPICEFSVDSKVSANN